MCLHGGEVSRLAREEDFDLPGFSRTINNAGGVNITRVYCEPVANRNQGCGGDTCCTCRMNAEIATQHESSFSAGYFDLDLQDAFCLPKVKSVVRSGW